MQNDMGVFDEILYNCMTSNKLKIRITDDKKYTLLHDLNIGHVSYSDPACIIMLF